MDSSSSVRIVVADDDPATRRLLTATLASAGYQVQSTEDGLQALQLIDRHHPELLIADCQMPRLDGLQLCRHLRDELPREAIYILAMSAAHSPITLSQALGCGADDLLAKPICAAELLARVQCGLRTFGLQRQLQQANSTAAANLDALAARADEIAATRDVAVFALATLAESRDPETGEHLERLRSYSQILAEELHRAGPYRAQIDLPMLEDLWRSTPLHDIGKVGIPDAILRKPGKLTPAEFDVMKRHTTIGAEALDKAMHHSGFGGFLAMAVDIARYHHERFDGTGYPLGLKGQDIPLPARIVALADVYDALTSVRCYKEAYPPEMARQMILEQEGLHFDPVVVDAFRSRFADFLEVRSSVERRGQTCLQAASAVAP